MTTEPGASYLWSGGWDVLCAKLASSLTSLFQGVNKGVLFYLRDERDELGGEEEEEETSLCVCVFNYSGSVGVRLLSTR